METLSIIIPMYNEEDTIRELLDRINSIDLQLKKEIIIVDDGSDDYSSGIIELVRSKYRNTVKIYTHQKNSGKGAAISTGLMHASGEIILIQDADLELDPAEYISLIHPIVNMGKKVVYGSRFLKKNENISFYTRICNKMLSSLTNILFFSKLTDQATAYKVFRKDVINRIKIDAKRFDFCSEVTAKILKESIEIYEVPISYYPRGRSQGKKISFWDGLCAAVTLIKHRICR